jgi:hypothetical protein
MPDPESIHSVPGPIVLFGSGETSPSAQKVFDYILQGMPTSPQIDLLETPAGFELNSAQVIGRIGDFLQHNLQNYHPQVKVVPARAKGSAFSPDNPEVVASLLTADMVFMGPGSPTYAVRQLEGSLAWHTLQARHRLGAALVFASAAVIAISRYALPVYEIYKVGEDLHWKPGLDLLGQYDLPLVFIPHWNNNDGGAELDTSRCFMGQRRFASLMALLPSGLTVMGIEENTALILEPAANEGRVIGAGGVTLIHTGHDHETYLDEADLSGTGLDDIVREHHSHVHTYQQGQVFALDDCCPMRVPVDGSGLPDTVWQQVIEAANMPDPAGPPPEVQELLHQRAAARAGKDWAASDALRLRIAALGWVVKDTKEGQVIEAL